MKVLPKQMKNNIRKSNDTFKRAKHQYYLKNWSNVSFWNAHQSNKIMKCIKTVNWGMERGRLVDSHYAENQTLCAGIHEYEGRQVVSIHIWKMSKKISKWWTMLRDTFVPCQGGFSSFPRQTSRCLVEYSLPLSYGISLEVVSQVGGPQAKPMSSGLRMWCGF